MTQLVKALERLDLAPEISDKLLDFSVLLQKWNRSINLSAARTADEIEEHLIDSLHIIPHLAGAQRGIDVGSGGGFPVVVAAICCPSLELTALEPVHKKHAFLRTAARELELANLQAIAGRVEDHQEHDYDVATSRATFDLASWMTAGLSLVRVGGRVFGFEGVERGDLPEGSTRHPYELSGKARAIIALHRTT